MSNDPRRFLRYLEAERNAALLYRALAQTVEGDRRDALLELADIEDEHAAHWVELLEGAGVPVPPQPTELDPTDAALVARARGTGLADVLSKLEEVEGADAGMYDDEPEAPDSMSQDEREHIEVFRSMRTGGSLPPIRTAGKGAVASTATGGGRFGEGWHRTDRSGALRAAVFGVSDGLVSNTALVMGFAGAETSNTTVFFAGLAGLLAGAFSMAAGEYVSVASQRDLFRREIEMEASELRDKPEEEQRELELIYRAKGLDRESAKSVAEQIMADPKTALDTLAREGVERRLWVGHDLLGNALGTLAIEALRSVDQLELALLLLGLVAKLGGLHLDLAPEEVALAGDADILARGHAECPSEKAGEPGEEHCRVAGLGAGEAHDECGVGDQAVTDAEDRGAQRPGPVGAMPALAEAPAPGRRRGHGSLAGRADGREGSTGAHRAEDLDVLSLVLRHRVGGLRLVVVHAGIGALDLFELAQHIGEARATGACHERGIGGVELGRLRRHRHAGTLEQLHPVRRMLVLDVGELEQGIATVAFDGLGERAVEQCRIALRLEIPKEPARVVRHAQPLPSVLPASAAAGSLSW